jgi:hypothetical protein
MHHGLLVAGLVIAERAGLEQFGLEQRLAQAGHVAVTEDAGAASEKPVLDPVPLGALRSQEPDDRLPHGQPHRASRYQLWTHRHRTLPLKSATGIPGQPAVAEGVRCLRS